MACNLTTGEVEYIDKTIADLKTENAKLREQIHWLKKGDILHVLTDQEYIDQCERERLMQVSIDALDKENAKLRELVRDMFYAVHPLDREKFLTNVVELVVGVDA